MWRKVKAFGYNPAFAKRGMLIFIENVSVTLCEQCGEEYLSGLVAERLGKLLDKESEPHVTLSVPVFNYKMAA